MQLHFYGWVDQTSYDYSKVKSEATRTVKRVMEENEIDLINPITQIQLEHSEPAPLKPKAKEGAAAAHDLAVDHDLTSQIDAEAHKDDLLAQAS